MCGRGPFQDIWSAKPPTRNGVSSVMELAYAHQSQLLASLPNSAISDITKAARKSAEVDIFAPWKLANPEHCRACSLPESQLLSFQHRAEWS